MAAQELSFSRASDCATCSGIVPMRRRARERNYCGSVTITCTSRRIRPGINGADDATTLLPRTATPQSLGVAQAVHRRRHRLAELDAAAARHGWSLEHLAPAVGTVVHGIDLGSELLLEGSWSSRASIIGAIHDSHRESHRRTLRLLFAERGALFFHGQQLDHEQHIALAKLFGPLETRHPFARLARAQTHGHPGGHPEIRIVHDGDGLIGTENNWHTDLSAQQMPPAASLLVARQMPELGGDTLFADMEAAYASLPDALQRRLCTLRAVHKLNPTTVDLVRQQYSDEDKEWFNSHWPGNLGGNAIEHPLVRVHPVTGRPSLFISPQQIDCVAGLEETESRELLRQLNALPSAPEFQCRFKWRGPGSVALCDSVRLQRCAVPGGWPATSVVEQVTISGSVPVQYTHGGTARVGDGTSKGNGPHGSTSKL